MDVLPDARVSVLFNESKLLKFARFTRLYHGFCSFSTLQRVEIAEIISTRTLWSSAQQSFSTLQRVEIAEISDNFRRFPAVNRCFSTLQRVEIAEI